MSEEDREAEDMFGKTCGKIKLNDLLDYCDIIFEQERGNDITEEVSLLANKGYGTSLKNIDNYFRNHLGKCYLCKEISENYLKEERGMLEDLIKIESVATGKSLESREVKGKIKFHKRRAELYRKFPIFHMEMGMEAYKLREYLDKENKMKPKKEYENHIKDCNFCKDFRKTWNSG